MNYIGSKLTLLPFLEDVFRQVADGSEQVFGDLFAGTGAVGRHFKKLGLQVFANDLQYYAFALNKAYLEINEPPAFTGLRALSPQEPLDFLNALPGVTGFITQHYSPAGGRMYYTEANAQRADAIRRAMDEWRAENVITEPEYFYVLGSLLEAIDQVANTASVYGAYLKQFKASALRPLQLKPLQLTNHVTGCRAWQRDANELVHEIECDVLYLDPPYNHRQYGANYHVLETIAAYDNPILKGVTGMRAYAKSDYCRKGTAQAALEALVCNARTKHIFLSYNDEGVLSLNEIQNILKLRGKPKKYQKKYSRYKADNNRNYRKETTFEYLHYVRVQS